MAELCDFALQQMVWELCGDCSGGELIASPADYKTRGVAVDITLGEEPLDVSAHHVYLIWRHRQARKRGCEELFAMDAAAGRKAVYWPRAMACIEGVAECQLVLSYADGGSMTSRTFLVRVQEELIGSVDPGDGFTLFVDVIKRYEDATADLLGVAEQLRAEAAEGGFKGEPGAPGKDGAPGRDGVDGKDGAPGRDGVDGKDGAPGRDGEPGPAGAPGRDGVDGKDGAPGRDGADGKPGEPGRDGVDGRDGASPNVTIETVDGVPMMKVECGGVVTQATVLAGPAGSQGERGEKGDPGTKGEPGEKGDKGEPGQQGPAGADGRDGTGVTHEWNGTVLRITSASGTSEADLQGHSSSFRYIAGTTFGGYGKKMTVSVKKGSCVAGDMIINEQQFIARVISVSEKNETWDDATIELLADTHGPGLHLIEGSDIAVGETCDADVYSYFVDSADYVLMWSSGCLCTIQSWGSPGYYRRAVTLKCIAKFGGASADLSGYASKAYVDEKISAAIPADLSEVSF